LFEPLNLWRRLVSKLILVVGLTLLVSITAWSLYNIKYRENTVMANLAAESDRLSNTIKLGTHYAMMINSREDIAEIIKNISRQPGIMTIRIYNKEGQIKYSDNPDEIDHTTNIKDEACYVCHRTDPPLSQLSLAERTRTFKAADGSRQLGILSAIYNEPGCSTEECHVHPKNKQVLGALDVVLSLSTSDHEMSVYKQRTVILTFLVFALASMAIIVFIWRFVNQPVARMIDGTREIAQGNHFIKLDVAQEDEMGQLARAITQMGKEIGKKQAELNQQRDEYQNLFELVPCIITVQNRDYKLINYNRMFSEKFDPKPGDYCYHAYKGRTEKCRPCPVEKTFEDGMPHHSEESGVDRDGSIRHWFVITSPVRDDTGRITSAMEISLDITERKQLEQELEKSEQKYHAIFNNIPNPVFVLDSDSHVVLDCNDSVMAVYGYDRSEICDRQFTELNRPEDRDDLTRQLNTYAVLNQVVQKHKDGRNIYVNIRVSPSEYNGHKVLLVTTSDITKRLEVEQQLAQASKLATLGEMATGVAHELNQPLSVIKTVSSFFIRKIRKKETLDPETLNTMLGKVDSNVDRANKIITHMRLFARKSDVKLMPVQINDVMEKAFDIFNQQLKVRGIEVIWNLTPDLPNILGDPDRLEQVFINLLINARDSIEERWEGQETQHGDKAITLSSRRDNKKVLVEVRDTGTGIDDDSLNKIFDPFFTTKEVGQGTGLGLSISYGIVKDCGGDIRVLKEPGPGACFVLSFPVKDGG
jgi:histidine kinase